jgi:hypothetical protein
VRIRALVYIAGAGFSLSPGDETDRFPPDEAIRLVAKRAAVMVDAVPSIQTAVLENLRIETRKPKRSRR